MPLLQNEHARSSPSVDLHVSIWPASAARVLELVIVEPYALQSGDQGAQSWPSPARRCERGDATQLPMVRLKHELRTGQTKRRALLHECNEQRAFETDVVVLRLCVEWLEEGVLARARV